MSAQGQWMSTVLPQQTRDMKSTYMVDRNCDWNLGLWSLIHDPRTKQQSLQEKQSSFKTHLLWWFVISRQSSEKRGKEAWNWLLSRLQASKGRSPVLQDRHQWNGCQIHDIWWTWHTSHPPITITIISVAMLTQVTFILTTCIFFIQRIISRAQLRGLTTHRQEEIQSEPAFIIPQDIDRGLTPGLSALLQETSPLAPYKWERSAKARARQAFSTMHWLLSRPLWEKCANWLLSRPLYICMDTTPSCWLLSRPLWFIIKLTHFKTLACLYTTLTVQIDSSQDPCDISSEID